MTFSSITRHFSFKKKQILELFTNMIPTLGRNYRRRGVADLAFRSAHPVLARRIFFGAQSDRSALESQRRSLARATARQRRRSLAVCDKKPPGSKKGDKLLSPRNDPKSQGGRSSSTTSGGRGGRDAAAILGECPPLLSRPLAWYSHRLETHPLATKCLTSGFISGAGDVLCQYLVHKNEVAATNNKEEGKEDEEILRTTAHHAEFQLDTERTARFAALGFTLVAPVVHLWYGSLVTRFPGRGVGRVLMRTFLDQAFFAPPLSSDVHAEPHVPGGKALG